MLHPVLVLVLVRTQSTPSMSFPRSPSPPPPMPSPQLVPTPLPSPPPFTKKPSRHRLTLQPQLSPPIPPSLIGSPLLKKTLNHFPSHDGLQRSSQTGIFGDDDDFGASKARENRRSTPLASRTIKRSVSHYPSRCRSPPPSPAIPTPPPPVPPIPAFVPPTPKHIRSSISPSPSAERPNRSPTLDLFLDRSTENRSPAAPKCCHAQSGGALTCMQFWAMHNPSGQCKA